jgi:hypothetical protein
MIMLRGMSLIINVVIDTVTLRQGREWDLLGPLFSLIAEGVDDIRKLRKDWLAVVIVIRVCKTFPPKFEYVFPLIVNRFIAW